MKNTWSLGIITALPSSAARHITATASCSNIPSPATDRTTFGFRITQRGGQHHTDRHRIQSLKKHRAFYSIPLSNQYCHTPASSPSHKFSCRSGHSNTLPPVSESSYLLQNSDSVRYGSTSLQSKITL